MRTYSIASLVIVRRPAMVLLGEKKSAEIGTGKLNAPGGKCESNESGIHCAIRETREEVGIRILSQDLTHIAVLTCFAGDQLFQRVHVYYTWEYEGVPVETSSMVPQWTPIDRLPFDRMHEGDRYWFDRAVRGERFRCSLWYQKPGEGYVRHAISKY